MPDLDINDVASIGLIQDIPGYQLPPEGWTTATDVRLVDDGISTGATWSQILNTSPASPWYIQAVRTPSQGQWYVYASLTDLFAWDQTTVANVSKSVSGYTTTNGWDWNGTQLAGIPVLTNNKDVPQYWTGINLASKFADVPGWVAVFGAGGTCKSIRAFGPYLVALNVSIGGVQHVHGVAWSHPADPGTMPISWDYTDTTKDAGFTELTDAAAGQVIDGLPLRNMLVVYKEQSTWIMRLIGGQYIMQFDPFLLATGILTEHCVALTGDGKYHFVATNDDIIIHDGVSTTSLLDRRMRRALFNRISTTAYVMSHCFAVPSKREMWFAYPENGQGAVSRALVWSYGAGTAPNGVLYECVFNFPSATIGDLVSQTDTWASDTEPWNVAIEPWSSSDRLRTIMVDPSGKRLLEMDAGTLRAGATFTPIVQRLGVSLIGNRRSSIGLAGVAGEPVVDFRTRKFIRRIWPKAEGGLLGVRLGFATFPSGAVTWSAQQTFDPASQSYLDFTVSGREAPSVEFTWIGNPATLYGYTLEVATAGRF
jgi:hypothetical protein